MNKNHVMAHLRFALESQLTSAQAAAKTAHDAATHEQSIAENKYDTLGLEAAYLAQGHAERVNDCYLSIAEFEKIFNDPVSNKVTIGSLVCTNDDDENTRWYYIGPLSGGLSITMKDTAVYVLTPLSPLGKALMNKQKDDEFEFQMGQKLHTLSVVSIL